VKRGDIYFASLEPTFGHEQQGHRPVIVLTGERYNRMTNLPIIAPITNGGSFAIQNGMAVPLEGFGLRTTGVVRCDQVRVLDLSSRGCRFVERAPDILTDEVAQIVWSAIAPPLQ
jgi:mRNA-degrading endonuclease toxin of MazEF toxin-antitoxin module